MKDVKGKGILYIILLMLFYLFVFSVAILFPLFAYIKWLPLNVNLKWIILIVLLVFVWIYWGVKELMAKIGRKK